MITTPQSLHSKRIGLVLLLLNAPFPSLFSSDQNYLKHPIQLFSSSSSVLCYSIHCPEKKQKHGAATFFRIYISVIISIPFLLNDGMVIHLVKQQAVAATKCLQFNQRCKEHLWFLTVILLIKYVTTLYQISS